MKKDDSMRQKRSLSISRFILSAKQREMGGDHSTVFESQDMGSLSNEWTGIQIPLQIAVE